MKYCVFWPARIVQPPPELGKPPRRKLCAFSFGTNNLWGNWHSVYRANITEFLIFLHYSGFVEIVNIKSYQQYRSKFIEKGNGALFKTAVQRADDYLMDPIVIISFFIFLIFSYCELIEFIPFSSNLCLRHFIKTDVRSLWITE